VIHAFEPPLRVHTPHGEGDAYLVLDYGLNTNTVWIVRLHGGEPRHYFSPDIRIYGNPMEGRGWDCTIPDDWVE